MVPPGPSLDTLALMSQQVSCTLPTHCFNNSVRKVLKLLCSKNESKLVQAMLQENLDPLEQSFQKIDKASTKPITTSNNMGNEKEHNLA